MYLLQSIFPHKARFSRGRRPRPCWISVKTIYWSGDFQERFFLFDPSLTSGMSAALMQGHCLRRSNFESCVWRTVSSQSSHHPQEVLLAQFSLYVHKGGLKPDSFHLFCLRRRPCIKQHMSAGRVAHRKCRRHRPPHLTRHVREGWINIDPTSQTASQH